MLKEVNFHYNIANNTDHLLTTILKLIGCPSDTPFCFNKSWTSLEEIELVKQYLIEFLASEIQLNTLEVKDNPILTAKFKKLVETMIECLDE